MERPAPQRVKLVDLVVEQDTLIPVDLA